MDKKTIKKLKQLTPSDIKQIIKVAKQNDKQEQDFNKNGFFLLPKIHIQKKVM